MRLVSLFSCVLLLDKPSVGDEVGLNYGNWAIGVGILVTCFILLVLSYFALRYMYKRNVGGQTSGRYARLDDPDLSFAADIEAAAEVDFDAGDVPFGNMKLRKLRQIDDDGDDDTEAILQWAEKSVPTSK